MIKLLWNTSRHQKDSFELTWGKYHEDNSKDWIYFLLQDIDYKSINSEEEIDKGDTVIIVDSGIHFKEHFYIKLNTLTKRFFLFHMGDEHLDKRTEPIYSYCDYIWRTYCSPKYFKSNKVKCIPPGYKSGFKQKFDLDKKRHYKWCFFGTQHKSSRHDMNFQLEKIKPNFVNRIDKFADKKKSANVEEMEKVFFNTNFTPCPAGFFHPESYRIYEALQCGTIPIVESVYNYFDNIYPSNPFIKINKWKEAKEIIDNWSDDQILNKRKECINWWNQYLSDHKNFIQEKIKE